MVQALHDEQAGVGIFPFGKLECDLRIGPVPAGTEEFSGRELIVAERDGMPQSGMLVLCGEHEPFLMTGMTAKSQLRCNGNVLPAGAGISAPQSAQLGKRYVDPITGVEILCIKPGDAPFVGDRPMWERTLKVLPSAD